VLSALLDTSHRRHKDVVDAVGSLEANSFFYVSAISLAELTFGVRLAEAFSSSKMSVLSNILNDVHNYGLLQVGRHTSSSYAELKTNLAKSYLARANRNHRPRWLEEWPLTNTGQKLQVDENDLWLCAQSKERSITLLTTDKRMNRIAAADPEVDLSFI